MLLGSRNGGSGNRNTGFNSGSGGGQRRISVDNGGK